MCNVICCNLRAWHAKMRNYQIYPYFLRDSVVLHDTRGGTVPNKQNFAPTAKRCAALLVAVLRAGSAARPIKTQLCLLGDTGHLISITLINTRM